MPSLATGGAERVFSLLMNHLCQRDLEIHLILIQSNTQDEFEVDERVHVHRLNAKRVLFSVGPLYQLLVGLKPDAVYSTLSHVNCLLLFIKPWLSNSIKVIVREGSIVSQNISAEKYPWLMRWLIKRFYPRANQIICQSKAMMEDLCGNFDIARTLCKVIYNPLDPKVRELQKEKIENPFKDRNKKNYVFTGRLDKVKRVDYIIDTFHRECTKGDHSLLSIIGDGPERPALEEQVKKLGLQEQVQFTGMQSDLIPWLVYSDGFVLSSRYEGLPNALIQAIACACPVAVEEHPGGSKEIMEKCNLINCWQKKLTFNNFNDRESSLAASATCLEAFDIKSISDSFLDVLSPS